MKMGLTFVQHGPLHLAIWLHTEEDPPDDLWTEALERVRKLKESLGGDLSRVRALVVTDGGAPNSTQRGVLVTGLLEGEVKSAVITTVLSNRLKRGIMTAISWLNPNVRGFPPNQLDQALAYLDIPGQSKLVMDALDELQKRMSPIETLKIMKA